MIHSTDLEEALRPMTAEEQARAFAALERLDRIRERMLVKRGGKLFPSAGALLDELQDEREAELL